MMTCSRKKNITLLSLFCLQENYDVIFLKQVYNSPVTTIPDLVSGKTEASETVRVTYRNKDQFKKSAKALGLMDDFKVRNTTFASGTPTRLIFSTMTTWTGSQASPELAIGELCLSFTGKDASFWHLLLIGKDMTQRGRKADGVLRLWSTS